LRQQRPRGRPGEIDVDAVVADGHGCHQIERFMPLHRRGPWRQTWAGYDAMRLLLKAIGDAGSTDPTAIRDALKNVDFTNVMGASVKFDDHNQGGKLVLIEGVADKTVKILKEVSLRN
jgi:branched-chain amino acid transport system substrate-binding protein